VLADLHGISGLQADVFKIGYAASAMPVRYAIERRKWRRLRSLSLWLGRSRMSLPSRHGRGRLDWRAVEIRQRRAGNSTDWRKPIRKLAGDDYWATQVHVQSNEALAWIAYAEGKKDDALKLMRAAADEEDAVEKRPVTPGAIVPAREQLGDMLLESNRVQEALSEFEKALTMAPQRRGALMGRAQARQTVAAEKS
jgi:tetratricopeptide (TPR) repeat protein